MYSFTITLALGLQATLKFPHDAFVAAPTTITEIYRQPVKQGTRDSFRSRI